MDYIGRIMDASTAYGVFGLTFEKMKTIDKKWLRREYRLLALQVHPDKNSSPNAESSFRKLHDAYEYLISMVPDIIENIMNTSNTGTEDIKSKVDELKTNTSKPEECNRKKKVVKPTVARSFKDIMKSWDEFEKQFQEENETVWINYKRKRERSNNQSSDTLEFDSLSDEFLEGVDERSCLWRAFQQSAEATSIKNTKPSATTNMSPNHSNPEKIVKNVIVNNFICWPCRRRFNSSELLLHHESMSVLHQINIQASTTSTNIT